MPLCGRVNGRRSIRRSRGIRAQAASRHRSRRISVSSSALLRTIRGSAEPRKWLDETEVGARPVTRHARVRSGAGDPASHAARMLISHLVAGRRMSRYAVICCAGELSPCDQEVLSQEVIHHTSQTLAPWYDDLSRRRLRAIGMVGSSPSAILPLVVGRLSGHVGGLGEGQSHRLRDFETRSIE